MSARLYGWWRGSDGSYTSPDGKWRAWKSRKAQRRWWHVVHKDGCHIEGKNIKALIRATRQDTDT